MWHQIRKFRQRLYLREPRTTSKKQDESVSGVCFKYFKPIVLEHLEEDRAVEFTSEDALRRRCKELGVLSGALYEGAKIRGEY